MCGNYSRHKLCLLPGAQWHRFEERMSSFASVRVRQHPCPRVQSLCSWALGWSSPPAISAEIQCSSTVILCAAVANAHTSLHLATFRCSSSRRLCTRRSFPLRTPIANHCTDYEELVREPVLEYVGGRVDVVKWSGMHSWACVCAERACLSIACRFCRMAQLLSMLTTRGSFMLLPIVTTLQSKSAFSVRGAHAPPSPC